MDANNEIKNFWLTVPECGEEHVEFHVRRHGLRVAADWGMLSEYRAERRRIRQKERERRARLKKVALGGAEKGGAGSNATRK